MDEARRARAEAWFRQRGLPSVVRGSSGLGDLTVRVAPAVAFLTVLEVLVTVFAAMTPDTEAAMGARLEDPNFALAYVVVAALTVILPLLAAWLVLRWNRGRRMRQLTITVVLVVSLVEIVLLPVIGHLAKVTDSVSEGVVENLLLVIALYVLVKIGAGSVLGWALRAALSQVKAVGTLTSKALPLLLLFATFLFLTTELWQVTATLTRARLWGVVAFFAVVGVVFLVSVLVEELRNLVQRVDRNVPPERLLATPFQMQARHPDHDEDPPLRRGEQLNLVFVLVLAQLLQVVVFGVLVFLFFLAFGVLAIDDDVIKSWTTHDPTPGTLFKLHLPLSNELIQVSVFLAVFSGLYFAASAATDPLYRQAFLQPLLDDVSVSLTARHLYLRDIS
ncbi:hypothetical protein [Kutzneria albida]|uniref:Integral membrane protein n=1 Tax=Kutzneria albida DSM 43870 TaxID=1449976 RepID=W5WK45_9PSEU|nr:hypothetical protein [Kutzneria albida]AHI00947.1 hypothetical protein KALB_7589 [Kutzneria albida DSM 43870]